MALADGLYVLDADVENPKRDRRKNPDHDWREAPRWQKGDKFRLHTWNTGERQTVELVGWRWAHQNLSTWPTTKDFPNPKWDALAAHLQPLDGPQTVGDLRHLVDNFDGDAWVVLQWLVNDGVLSLSQTRALLERAKEQE